jgi:hypothetical protein
VDTVGVTPSTGSQCGNYFLAVASIYLPTHCVRQWFPKSAPQRPLELRLPHRGAARYYPIFIIIFPFSIQCHRTRYIVELVQTT